MSHDPNIPQRSAVVQQHEGTGVNSRIIFLCGFGLLTMIAVSMLVASRIRPIYVRPHSPSTRLPGNSQAVVNSRLDPQEKRTRQAYEKDQLERLSTYGWSDRSRGKVRIPIERAMSILIEKNRSSE